MTSAEHSSFTFFCCSVHVKIDDVQIRDYTGWMDKLDSRIGYSISASLKKCDHLLVNVTDIYLRFSEI